MLLIFLGWDTEKEEEEEEEYATPDLSPSISHTHTHTQFRFVHKKSLWPTHTLKTDQGRSIRNHWLGCWKSPRWFRFRFSDLKRKSFFYKNDRKKNHSKTVFVTLNYPPGLINSNFISIQSLNFFSFRWISQSYEQQQHQFVSSIIQSSLLWPDIQLVGCWVNGGQKENQ